MSSTGGLRRPWSIVVAARLLAAEADGGEIRRDLAAPSPTLGRDIPYSLYLPDGYGESAERYPVLFVLHGLGGSEAD